MSSPASETSTVDDLRRRLADVRARVADAAAAVDRDADEVRVLLATKTLPADVVRAAVLAGGTLLGENRVQELAVKAPALSDLEPEIHQSNKVPAAVRWAQCVESLDSMRLARLLSERSTGAERVLDVMVQVNVSGEETKSGVRPEEAADLAQEVAGMPGLRLTGFMTIGGRSHDHEQVRAGFALLRSVRDEVLASGSPGTSSARELSMGMSGDLEDAVAEGATIIRVGTAVFGARPG